MVLCLLFSTRSYAQLLQIRGQVIDKANGHPLPQASVFISNTSIGTVTDESGRFQLSGNYLGNSELVVSYIGYETVALRLEGKTDSFLLIPLPARNEELQSIIVRNYEKNGWDHWGFLFKNNFLGVSTYADNCRILNEKAIGFIYSEEKQVLNAYAAEPIVIINKKLGYRIEFRLEHFTFNMSTKLLFFEGYTSFQDLPGSERQKAKWANERHKVFNGSFMMFARLLCQNKLLENGFVVHKLIRVPNKEKQRVKFKLDYMVNTLHNDKDSLAYYKRVMDQSDYSDYLLKDTLSFNQIAYRISANSVQLKFKDYLYITYPSNKANEPIFQFRRDVTSNGLFTSIINLENSGGVAIYDNGAYHDPTGIIFTGYWEWSEKIGMMLPLDYSPNL